MSEIAIKFENISKQYRLGLVSTQTLSHDLNRWWQTSILRKEDPYLKIGETNDRASKGNSEYVWALHDITFDVKQGEVLGIIGKNGAGKSTLLKILSRVTTPTTGIIKARGRIASLLEVGTGFHPELTGRENIYMNGSIMGMTKKEITDKLDEIVDFAGVERYLDTPTKRYSSGMTVRLGFSVAAHLEPEILVVDEVLAVGDAEFQKKAIGKMQDVSRGEGRAILFVSHNMSAIKSLCNRGVVLENGVVKYSSNAIEAVAHYLKTDELTEGKPLISKLQMRSREITINEVTVNDSPFNHIFLSYPERKLHIKIKGQALNKMKIGIECHLFDNQEIKLGKFTPCKQGINIINAGNFTIEDTIQLPMNIANGDYYLQIEVTHPNVEYLAVIPKGLLLTTQNYVDEEGKFLNYGAYGFLCL
jgi:lipopolysaccharide transport system ATP-binding protein